MYNKSIRLVAVGDISLGDHYFSMGHGVRSMLQKRGMKPVFKEVVNHFKSSDIVIANLEGVLSKYSCKENDDIEGFVFRGEEDMAFGLKAAGINAVNVANNHILQHGHIAWKNTIKSLKAAGVAIVGQKGTGGFLCQPVYINVKGIKVALLGYSAVPEAYFPESNVYALADQNSIIRDIQLCHECANIVVVSIHQGVEGCTLPEYELVMRCKSIADAGANIVLAHHAHVFHPVEIYHESCIAYGLGNFLFDLFWDDSLVESGVLTIDLCASGSIESFNIMPVKLEKDMTLQIMNGDKKEVFLRKIKMVLSLLDDGNQYKIDFQNKVAIDVSVLEKKKLRYFLKNILKGNTRKKLHFILRKVLNKIILGN